MVTSLIIFALTIMATFNTDPATSKQASVTDNHFIEIEGVNLHYRTGGSGQVLLLLHGFTLSSDQWEPFVEIFAENHTVIAMDMPGHGRSDVLGEKFRFERWSELMIKMLDRMQIKKIYAAGHSAGAITLMHMAVQNPDLIEAMVLVSGGHLYKEEAREDLRYDSFDKASEALQQYYMDIHFSDEDKIRKMFDDINNMADQIPVDEESAPLNPIVLAGIPSPVLLVWGDRDLYFPVEVAVNLHRFLPNSGLWIIPNQGHTPVWSFLGGDKNSENEFPVRANMLFHETKTQR
jgi:pimeloyl-ACP methyl ester carboxylesterase